MYRLRNVPYYLFCNMAVSFSTDCFHSVFIKPRPFISARLCAKPLALTCSLCVFTVGIFPRFLKNFLIFDE